MRYLPRGSDAGNYDSKISARGARLADFAKHRYHQRAPESTTRTSRREDRRPRQKSSRV